MSSRTGSAQRNPEGGRWSRWAEEREKGAMVLEKEREGEREREKERAMVFAFLVVA